MIWFWVIFTFVMIFGFVVFVGAPYVPSRPSFIRQAFGELYKLSKKDVLVDIGSGDGAVLREAARNGVGKAVGFEVNPVLYVFSRLFSYKYNNVKLILSDFWFSHLPANTTVVYLFCVTRDVHKFEAKLQKEVNNIGHPVHLIVLGPEFRKFKLIKEKGPYYLYLVNPLHTKNA